MPSVTLTKSNSVARNVFIDEFAPTSTNNTQTAFNVGVSSAANRRVHGLLSFDLGLIPNDAIINSATLILDALGGYAKTLNIHKVTSAWDEGVTWNTRPTFDSTVRASITKGTAAVKLNIDLKGLVQEWVNGASVNFGVLIKNSDETVLNNVDAYNSTRNPTTANQPQLVIDYTIPTTGKKQVEVVGPVTTGTASTPTYSPALPSQAQAGDLVVFQVMFNNNYTVTPPAGWTTHVQGLNSANGRTYLLISKIIGAGEAAPQFSATSASEWYHAAYVFRNVKSVLQKASTFPQNTAGFSPVASGGNVTVTSDNALFALFNMTNAASFTPPLSYQELFDQVISGSTFGELSYRYMHKNRAQTYSEMLSTASSSTSYGVSAVLALEPITNNPPTLTLTSPADNQVLSEGSTYVIAGSASDPDTGNAVTVKYAINGGTARNITSAVSDGSTAIPFSKTLTFSGGHLYDGATDVSGALADNITYTLSVYAVDDQGGTSTSYTRTFTVINNRPPAITLDAYSANQTNKSELETLTFTGTLTDPEGDTITLTAVFNGGTPQTLKTAVASGTTFSYAIPVASLVQGTNTLVLTATDAKGASKTKTLTFTKTGTFAPVNRAVARYAITPPLGTTAELAAWVNRESGDLTVTAASSIVAANAPESFLAMTKNASSTLDNGEVEDEFVYTTATPGAKVTLKLDLTRSSSSSTQGVKKITGGIG